MNAPYDRDRGDAPGGGEPTAPGGQDAQERYPYRQYPYGRNTSQPAPQGTHGQPGRGGDSATVRFTGVDDMLEAGARESGGRARDDAFAHLFHDQQASPSQEHRQYPPAGQPTGQQEEPYEQGEPYEQHQPSGPYAPQDPYAPQAAPGAQSPYGHRESYGRPPRPGPQQPPSPAVSGPQSPPPPPPPQAAPEAEGTPTDPPPAAAGRSARRGGGILKSSAIMAAGTMVSRLTGFVRTLVITAALGAALLGDAYTVAYTLPTMIYILSIGGGLNSVFVPQLVRAMKNDEDGGEAYANRLLTLVMVVLGGLVALTVLGAPLLVRALSVQIADDPAANNVAVTFARYCLPTIFFMGVHVVMGQILNARGRFGAMMWTPVLNNVVIITTFGLFIWVYGTARTSGMSVETIPPEGVRLLGVGTLLGLVVQALAMIPYLRATGFRVRPRFDWRGHGLGKAARLAKWTFLFVLANQAGVLVVTQLATWAGKAADAEGHPGTGILGYSNAQLIWQMPQAIITVSVMAALLPRISRAAHDGDPAAVRDDISHGLRTSAVAIVPVSFAFVALGVPMCLLMYFSAGIDAATSMGYILMAFGLGLIPYSVQYVVLRGFYAYEDTRTPFYNTVIVAACNAAGSALAFLLLPSRWAVVGMAAAYGLAYAVGVGVAWKRLSRKLGGDLDGPRIVRAYARLCGAGTPAALAGGAVAYAVVRALGPGVVSGAAALAAGGLVLGAVFVLTARRMRVEELTAMMGMVRAKLGR
ncbi:murein biosynthesis integral membrane protein MurJ [Streptomyces pini]|uniref:Putative peptidoglycan lipid II flippase n=1 Tax=Streptomyces pini TaxID=1520580 RepID=A0A1I4J991_9ACTN|nr:murein biosynthesis integral membrane protein MurJ [Streptomyces pini]SFL62791.1 putative peptidoglycan lipid II flippase [Streptomyces pini]